jgi:TRAP transporter TAXI family solute receptor
MKGKFLQIIGMGCLAFIMSVAPLLSGCAEEGAPTPAQEGERIELQILSNPLGNTGYVMSFGLADMINKYSNKYHATCVETKTCWYNQVYLIEHPEERENTIIFTNTPTMESGKAGYEPFEEPCSDFKWISQFSGSVAIFLASNDPDITTIEDMAGKRVCLGNKGASPELVPRLIISYGYDGIWDTLKLSYATFSGARDALVDRTADVGAFSGTVYEEGGDWKANPASEEALTTTSCHLISFSEEAMAKAAAETGFGLYPVVMGPKDYGKTIVEEPCTAALANLAWAVHKSMPDEYVQDVLEIIYEHVDEFADIHATGKMMDKTNLATLAGKKDEFHPAAIKFYEEKGIKIGM